MEYKLLIVDSRIWVKDLSKIHEKEYKKIKKTILSLKKFPEKGDIKRLTMYPIADYRLSIGKYRVLFDVDKKNKKILLYRILHRKDSYRI